MKKLFSLLFVALLTMSAWAETTVTFVPGNPMGTGTTASDADASMTLDGVTISSTLGALGRTDNFRFGKDAVVTVSSSVGNITKVEFTSTANYGSQYGPHLFEGTGYSAQSGSKVGTWTGNAASFELTATAQVRCSQIVVTIGGEPPVETLAAPVFTPNGGEFTGSLAVTVSCPTEDASIMLFKVVDGQDQYVNYYYQSGEFYVTETSTYRAYAYKGDDMSEYTTATFTKVVPTCATPTFNPASGTTFNQGEMLSVVISSATEGATITYTVNDGDVFEGTTPVTVPVDMTTTITAMASKEGYNNSEEATATYTMLEPYTVGGTATFVALTDTIEGGTDTGWHTIVKDGVTMKFYGTVSNYTDNSGKEYHEYRIHKNQSIEFTTSAGNIRKIEFTCSSSNPASGFDAHEGLTLDGDNGIWEGLTRDITFTTYPKQVRCTQIVVTLDDDAPAIVVADPVFNYENNYKFVNTLDVTITCETEGAQIYYAINDGEFQAYDAATPITLNETSTVKAYAELEGVQSNEVTAKYIKLVEVSTIAELNGLNSKIDFIFYGNVVTVFQNGNYLFVKDGTGYGLIYGNQVPKNIPDGSTLKEEWYAQTYWFRDNMIHEYQYPNNVVVDDEEPLVTIVPTEYAEADITTDKINERVIVKGLTLTAGAEKYLYTADGMPIYNQFAIDYPTELEGKTFDVEGMVFYYDGKVQIMPIAITEVQATEYIRGDVDNNGEVKIGDVTALINYLLSGDASEINLQAADCDENGEIKIGDVTALINYLLSGSWE